MLGEDRADLTRDLAIDVEARRNEEELRAFAPRRDRRHGRAHAEGAGLIACRRDDAALARAAHRDGLAAQLGFVALLDRRVEGVHVDVDDLARPCRRCAGTKLA